MEYEVRHDGRFNDEVWNTLEKSCKKDMVTSELHEETLTIKIKMNVKYINLNQEILKVD